MISNLSQNISFSGKLNVFSINPETRLIEVRVVDTSSIKGVTSSLQGYDVVNTLLYRTNDGIKKCYYIELSSDYSLDEFKLYLKEQCIKANKSGNVVDILL